MELHGIKRSDDDLYIQLNILVEAKTIWYLLAKIEA
jgi:hypothetical protein